jgi:hypothetical protein
MKRWIQNYGVTFTVDAETAEEAEEMFERLVASEMGSHFLKTAWSDDIEEMV